MDEPRFDWSRVRAFLATAEAGSLSAAARRLGLTQPTLGRQVAALEVELGVLLFDRAGRDLRLTPAGHDLLDHARAMGAAATALGLAASGKSEALAGPIRITASEAFAAHVLPPVIGDLRARHPGITVDIVARNEVQDLTRREADIAVRNTDPGHPDLIARKCRDALGHFYATPAYLAALGFDGRIETLEGATWIGWPDTAPMLRLLGEMGVPVAGEAMPLTSANHLVQWELAKRGHGIGVMDAAIGAAEPAVVPVLPERLAVPFPVWLVAHRELKSSRRVRVVFDILADALSRTTLPTSSPR